MSKSILSVFFSRSFIIWGLTFKSLIHFKFIFMYGVRKCSNYSFTSKHPVFLAQLIEEIVFSPLYILDPFLIDYLTRGVLCSFWALYSVPLTYMSVFITVFMSILVTIGLWYRLKSGSMTPSASFFFLNITLAIQGLLWVHIIFWIICYNFVKKKVMGILIQIVLNL